MNAYDDGMDMLAGGLLAVGDDGGIPEWDNRHSFLAGDLVRYNGRYWRALHDVDPPLFPSIMSGEVPGDSDQWRAAGNSAAREQLKGGGGPRGRTIMGVLDIDGWSRQMAELKQVPVNVANVMLRYGLQIILPLVAADELRAKQAFMSALPGASARANVKGKLEWHADRLKETNTAMDQLRLDPRKYNTTLDEINATIYSPGDDLKKWVTQAFIEANAVEEGLATLESAWNQMWAEIKTELAKLPREALKAVGSAAGGALEAVTGVPLWGLAVGGAVVVGGLGYLAYKFGGRR